MELRVRTNASIGLMLLVLLTSHIDAITLSFPVNADDRLRDGFVANDSLPIPVQDGLWWNPAEPGSGYSVLIRERTGFVSWYSYETNGRPTFYTVQGTLTRLGELDRIRLGYAVVLTGPLLRSSGGQAPGGAHTAPSTSDAGIGTAEFRFLDSRRAELRLTQNGVARAPVSIQPFDPEGVPEDELLLGRWAISWRYQPGEVTRALVEVSRSSITSVNDWPFVPSGPGDPFSAFSCDRARTTFLPNDLKPPPGSRFYEFRCLEGCVAPVSASPQPPGLQTRIASPTSLSISRHVPQWLFWYSPALRQFGRLVYLQPNGVFSCSDPADLFVTKDQIIGRARRVVPFGSNTTPLHHTEFVLSRMPGEAFDRYLSLPE
jgi:hypothetical protein